MFDKVRGAWRVWRRWRRAKRRAKVFRKSLTKSKTTQNVAAAGGGVVAVAALVVEWLGDRFPDLLGGEATQNAVLVVVATVVVPLVSRAIAWWRKKGELRVDPRSLLVLLLPALVWLAYGAPTALDVPVLQGFNFQGGVTVSPEFSALLLGLVLYTSAFVAEIVRAGIQAVTRGQIEAAMSIGLRPGQVLHLVVMPQALRVIVPPLTSQMLNLTKNSSLAIAIGYADFVSVANTTINQTGQAIEGVALIMAVYLCFSLSTSAFMNWYNKKTALVER